MGCNGSKSLSVIEPTGIIKKFARKGKNKNEWNDESLGVVAANGQNQSTPEDSISNSSYYNGGKKFDEDDASIATSVNLLDDANDSNNKDQCQLKVCQSKYSGVKNTESTVSDDFESYTMMRKQSEEEESGYNVDNEGWIRQHTDDENRSEHCEDEECTNDEYSEEEEEVEEDKNEDSLECLNDEYDRDIEYCTETSEDNDITRDQSTRKKMVPCVFNLEFAGADSSNRQAQRVRVCGILEMAQNSQEIK